MNVKDVIKRDAILAALQSQPPGDYLTTVRRAARVLKVRSRVLLTVLGGGRLFGVPQPKGP